MQRFFVSGGDIERITGAEHGHLSRSLRLREGERVELIDGDAIYSAQIVKVGREETTVRVLERLPSREAALRATLYVGALKGEKMELVAQKAVELGAHALVPVTMARSVAQGAGKQDRLLRIAREAQKQCGREGALRISAPMPFEQALQAMKGHKALLVAYEGGGAPFAVQKGERDVAVVIGPEGGIDPKEVSGLLHIGARAVSLGSRILRAETAAIAALSGLMALAGEWA